MKKIVLATKRHWHWKVFLVLFVLINPASFAIVPYAIHQQNVLFGWEMLVLDRLVNSILPLSLLGGVGSVLANRIGLGMPFIEAWVKREPVSYRFRQITAIAWISAVVLVLLAMFLHAVVFDPPLNALLEKTGVALPEATAMPPLYGFLASISAGITEELLFRLFGLSLIAWLGGLLFHDSEGRPKLIVFWTANILFALAFGAAHLPTEAAIGLPLNPLVVTSTLVLNGVGGLVFGWLFWTFGLESAILTHILADILRHSLIPFITIQSGETASALPISGLSVAILVTLILACWSLMVESRGHPLQVTD
jgi:hypothetical protein